MNVISNYYPNGHALYEKYCIEKCVQWIDENKFSKVALQVPNEDKKNSVYIHTVLRTEAECNIFEIMKSSDGCCPWQLDASRQDADAIIHFGETCLSHSTHLPVLFVLNSSQVIDLEKFQQTVDALNIPQDERLILVYDSCNANLSEQIFSSLKSKYSHLIHSTLEPPEVAYLVTENSCIQSRSENTTSAITSLQGRVINLPDGVCISDYNFIYVGSSIEALRVLQYRYPQSTFYHIDNDCHAQTFTSSTKLVTCRSAKIEKIKEADWIGVVQGILTLKGNIELKARMRHICKNASKKVTQIILMDMSESKLANFALCDIFVYINCPQSSLFDRLEEPYLYQKLVTPWELEVALNPRFQWSLNFELNFLAFLPGGELHTELEPLPPHVWPPVITDTLGESDDSIKDISIRHNGALSLISTTNLQTNNWRGLDPNIEAATDLNVIVKGRKGIAIAYENEGDKS